MSTENGKPENTKPKESELPDAATKLYVKEQCDKTRTQAIGIFAFIAVILAIGTGLGIWNGARAYIEVLMKGDQLQSVRARAESSALAATNSASTAQNAAERAQLEVARIIALNEQAQKSGLVSRLDGLDAQLKAKIGKLTLDTTEVVFHEPLGTNSAILNTKTPGRIVGAWYCPIDNLGDFGGMHAIRVTVVDDSHVKLDWDQTRNLFLRVQVFMLIAGA